MEVREERGLAGGLGVLRAGSCAAPLLTMAPGT
jgi:hypothetical protein